MTNARPYRIELYDAKRLKCGDLHRFYSSELAAIRACDLIADAMDAIGISYRMILRTDNAENRLVQNWAN